VINVSWEDAVAYAAWLSGQTGKRYRLPSEAEWEYAARGGGKEEKWAGTSAEEELGAYAWYKRNSNRKTHPVGEKKPNRLGLYDMSGNVWEWVADWKNDGYAGAPDDGSAWESGDSGPRVIRGGYYDLNPVALRSAYRSSSHRTNRDSHTGFRLAQDL
jgi:formylglycine-generating enzyme required for sulfatase activity